MKLLLPLLLIAPLAIRSQTGSDTPKQLAHEEERVTIARNGGYFPVLVHLRSGELMAVLRGGAPHRGIAGRLDLVTSKDDGRSWSGPRTVIDSPEDDRNPALGELKNGTILLAYCILTGYDATGLKSIPEKTRVLGVYVSRSMDQGKTWTPAQRSEAIYSFAGRGGASPYGKIIQLADGTVLMAVYCSVPGAGHGAYIFRSKDNGVTWEDPTRIASEANETALALLRDGTILAAVRSDKGEHLEITSSHDAGRTWTTPKQITKDQEHPGDLIQLKDGRVLLTYGERNKPYGVQAMLSSDSGQTWDQNDKIVIASDGVNWDCGYPSSVQLANGKIVTVYYRVGNPDDVPRSTEATAVTWSAPSESSR